MARMTRQEAEAFLASVDHRGTAILSVGRPGRGPISVPLSFSYGDGVFRFVTKRSRRHARAFLAAGRATVLVHHEDYDGRQYERYVFAEGPIGFVDGEGAGDDDFATAELTPDTFVGVVYEFE